MDSRPVRLWAAAALGCAVAGCHQPRGHADATPWLEFPWPEADLLFQRDPHWVGGDGAYSIDLGNGRVLWLFGDSWIDPSGNGTRDGAVMVSNSLAIQRGYDPSRATAEFFWGETPEGKPGAFFSDVDGVRYWPGHGVRLGDRLLLFLMRVRPTGTGLGFEVADWDAVLVTNPDHDPQDWDYQWLETPPNQRQIIVGSGGVLQLDGRVYAFGAQEPGPGHDVFLVRWDQADLLEERLGGIEWWAGTEHGWRPDPEGRARAEPVFREGQTEFTVHYDANRERFVEYQTVGFGAAVIVRREASELTGPWSSPDTVFVPPQGQFSRIMLYQGKAHPHLAGADVVVTYCTNSFDFGDHVTEPWVYYPRFVRLARHGLE